MFNKVKNGIQGYGTTIAEILRALFVGEYAYITSRNIGMGIMSSTFSKVSSFIALYIHALTVLNGIDRVKKRSGRDINRLVNI